jgi:hypothetical protein
MRIVAAIAAGMLSLGVWMAIGQPNAVWYGPPVNPALNSGLVISFDNGHCVGIEVTGHPGAFGECG